MSRRWSIAAALIVLATAAAAQDAPISIGTYRLDLTNPDYVSQIPIELRAEPAAPNVPHWRIVQLDGPPDRTSAARLRQVFGLTLTQYVGGGAYLERVTPETAAELMRSGLVRASEPFHPAFKISRFIGNVETVDGERRTAQNGLRLRARLFDIADVRATRTAFERAGVNVVSVLDDREIGGSADVTFELWQRAQLIAVARIDGVRRIETVGRIVPSNADAASVTQSGDAQDPTIWKRGLAGAGQRVGVIDEGSLDLEHCFFRDPSVDSPGPDHRKVISMRDPTVLPSDHATFSAGIAAGDDLCQAGAHPDRGGAWAARLSTGTFQGIGYEGTKSLAAELSRARDDGAYVHSNSWSLRTSEAYDFLAEDVDRFTWENEDHLVIGAMANKDKPGAPATAPNALAVSAAQMNPMNFGGGLDGPVGARRKPDLLAVGCDVRSALVSSGTDRCEVGMYDSRKPCATSHAAPNAAAAAVLARQYYVEGWYPSGAPNPADGIQPTGALLKATLLNSTRDMSGVPGYPSNREGWGVITLDRALHFAGDAHDLHVWQVRNSDANSLYTGDTACPYTVQVANPHWPLKITLVWTGPARSADSADLEGVNDLDLLVLAPGGQETYLGNYFVGGQSTTGGTADPYNNVEQFLITQPALGEWTIRVVASSIFVPGQGYALVVSSPADGAASPTPDPPLLRDVNTDGIDPVQRDVGARAREGGDMPRAAICPPGALRIK